MNDDDELLNEAAPVQLEAPDWGPEEPDRPQFSLWRIAAVLAAGILLVLGGGAQIHGWVRGERGAGMPDGGAAAPELLNQLMAEPGSLAGAAGADAARAAGDPLDAETFLQEWSPSFTRWGFSFFVGLAVGYTLRVFYRIGLLIAGLVALSLFGLSSIGVVTVNWAVLEGQFNQAAAGIRDSFGQLQSLLKGSLPAAGMAGLGFVTGFTGRR